VKTRFNQHVNDANRFRGNTAIGNAIRKYGKESFSIKTIACCKCLDDALFLEKLLIKQHETLRPNGYNVTHGGEAGFNWMNDKERAVSRKKASLKLKGRIVDPVVKNKISIAKKGKPLTKKILIL
jgi:hypothetical protein